MCTPIVALDVPTGLQALGIVELLGERCRFYKVGLELFTAEGPSIVERLRGEGCEVFVDLKLHDIPNTVRSAARVVSRMGASLLTVHASGGAEMVRAAVEGFSEGASEGASGASVAAPGILGVTVLTSHSAASQAAAWGRGGGAAGLDVEEEVLRLASVTRGAGALGIVCSGHEAAAVRSREPSLGLLIPGIRLAGGEHHDQARVMTPGGAKAAGARWIILGRAVTAAPDPQLAMERVWTELGGAG